MKRVGLGSAAVVVALLLAFVFAGCSLVGTDSEATGTMRLSITDAPVDSSIVTGVYVTIEDVQYNRNGEWEDMVGFDGPKQYDLLELTDGKSELLGDLVLPVGEYAQIRFMLDVAERGQGSGGPPSNPGSYVELNGDSEDPTKEPLFVPSGGQSGYKAHVGDEETFTVPENGEVAVTADFDLRKALVRTGGNDPRYILKPVVRLIVEGQAGSIEGTVSYSGSGTAEKLVVYAYEDGTFASSEADDPADGEDEDSRFPGAVTSAVAKDIDDDGTREYTLAFLAEGTYDLVVAEYDDEGAYLGSGESVDLGGVKVTAGQTTTEDLTE
jgi:hypothetical protein